MKNTIHLILQNKNKIVLTSYRTLELKKKKHVILQIVMEHVTQ